MKKVSFIYIIFILGILAPACQKPAATEEALMPIVFSAAEGGMELETKAAEVTTANLTSIYVTATRGTVGESETATFTSANFTGTAGGDFNGGKYWPSTNPTYHFYSSNVSHSFSSNSCTVAANTETDVVCAYLESPSYLTKNTLTFNHIFGRVGTMTVNPTPGYSISAVTVYITPRTSGTYNLRTGAWSSVSDGAQTTLGTSNNNLYLVPGDYTLTISYTLTKGEFVKSYTHNATVNLSAGVTNNITATTFPDEAEQIIVSVSVAEWGTNNINGNFS